MDEQPQAELVECPPIKAPRPRPTYLSAPDADLPTFHVLGRRMGGRTLSRPGPVAVAPVVCLEARRRAGLFVGE